MPSNPLLNFHRWHSRAWHVWFRLARPMTLGVQGMVLDDANRVFLVRHSYVAGWHFPGGGVEAGETVLAALERELREEGNLEIRTPPHLHGVFFNTLNSNRDHVVVYVIRDAYQSAPRAADAEIVEAGFFALDNLPQGTTRAARARLSEVLQGSPIAPLW